ncbi:MAG: PEGA domain-containing protein [Ignavibacteriota bacterium]|jgi:hypothetical protein|nr:PEGA domain-containing protein [Ignavibacteriota bacterium]QKJ96086.1 MAG: PEGA domain-containing protein [Ignavibacteriota bacterium]GIK59598.1 MAG: hypothetical protein BroJett017_04880 [Ignavibacteriota bacterium]
MKNMFYLMQALLVILLINSCSDEPASPRLPEGNLLITSFPDGAQIWIDGMNTMQTTNDTVFDIEEGVHDITLKRIEYVDTTFSVNIIADERITVGPIELESDIQTISFNPVRIYESANSQSLPSGLDLSSGNRWGISSDSSNLVDIYYYSDATGSSHLIRSSHFAGLIKETDFLVGPGTNLLDGSDSPLRNTETWANNVDKSEDNYVFLYDDDDHYSKFLIVNRGGGSGPGDPAYVDVQWYYNKEVQDNRFK